MAKLNKESVDKMAEQAGLITRRQLLDYGHTAGEIEGMVERELLVVVQRAVYGPPGAGEPPERPAMARVLRSNGGKLTGPHALALLGIEAFTTADQIWVLLPPGRRLCNVDFEVHEDPAPDYMNAKILCVPAVTATRSWVDTAAVFGGTRPVRAAFDELRWRGLTNVDRALRCAEHLRADGVTALLGSGVFDYDSEGERDAAVLMLGMRPQPVLQFKVSKRYRVDFCWPNVKLVVEYLGKRRHDGIDDEAIDLVRDAELRGLGYEIIYLRSGDLRAPKATRARVEAAHRARAAAVEHSGIEPLASSMPSKRSTN